MQDKFYFDKETEPFKKAKISAKYATVPEFHPKKSHAVIKSSKGKYQTNLQPKKKKRK